MQVGFVEQQDVLKNKLFAIFWKFLEQYVEHPR
jgi:hypothetical protein